MKLYTKHMAILPCKIPLKEELERLKIPFGFIDDGVMELPDDLNVKQRENLNESLLSYGLKLYSTKKGILFERIRDTILEMIMYSDGHPVLSYSIHLSTKLNYDYTYLANIFSEMSGISIQQYIIISKIEKVKEFLIRNINLSEISFLLHYSSVAHLSGQFKKVTGLSPSNYKLMVLQQENLIKII